jgi:hypothetical protein
VKNSPGTVYKNIHRDTDDVYVVLGEFVDRQIPVTLVMWSNGNLAWYATVSIGNLSDRKL